MIRGQLPKCSECRYWTGNNGNEESGECRYSAPVMSNSPGGYWPVTEDNDFCGDGEFA